MRGRALAKRLLATMLGTLLLLAPVREARAGLTEMVVGGTLLIQAVQVFGELLPQITTLGQSVVTLMQSGKSASDTLGRIFQAFFQPANGRKKAPTAQRGPSTPIVVPVISGPTSSPTTVASNEPTPISTAPSALVAQLGRLVESYQDETASVSALPSSGAAAGRASSVRPVSHGGYSTEATQTAALLVEALRDRDTRGIEAFASAADSLPAADREAVAPVIRQALGRGRRFSRLHGDDSAADARLYERLSRIGSSSR